MILKSLLLKGFTVWQYGELAMPESGVVFVCGANGSGKSSIVEGLAWCLWGRTLRGDDPWTEGRPCVVEAVIEVGGTRFRVLRERKGKKTIMEWAVDDGRVPQAFETTTKAQDALTAHIGELEFWRHTHVFSSSDAAQFSGATDAERKRLLEDALGLDALDRAGTLARNEATAATSALALAQRDAHNATTLAQQTELADIDAERALDATPPVGDEPAKPDENEASPAELTVLADGAAATEKLRQTKSSVTATQADVTSVTSKIARLQRTMDADAHDLKHVRASLSGGDEACRTCGQTIPADKRAAIVADAQAREVALVANIAKNQAELDGLSAERTELLADVETYQAEVAKHTAVVQALQVRLGELRANRTSSVRVWEAEHATWKGRVRALELAAGVKLRTSRADEDARKRVAVANDALTAAQAKAATAGVVAVVLGTRGVRAAVLGNALAGLQVCANGWLAQIATGMAIELSETTEGKSGSTRDAISLTVTRSDASKRGYKSCSGGERRRVDVALLLGLAELADAASGEDTGLLALDEIFDSLDADGVEAVASALAEIGTRRPVLVVTHNPLLLERLPQAERWTIVNGTRAVN
jgi:DNA repair exonuclease SbcCD ATPase subunit